MEDNSENLMPIDMDVDPVAEEVPGNQKGNGDNSNKDFNTETSASAELQIADSTDIYISRQCYYYKAARSKKL